MKILLRRHIKTTSGGMLGGTKTTYALDVRAELTPEEKAALEAYPPLWKSILYQRLPAGDERESLLPIPAVQVPETTSVTITIKDAVDGITVETKDPTQPLIIIDRIKSKAAFLKQLLASTGDLTGEELVEI